MGYGQRGEIKSARWVPTRGGGIRGQSPEMEIQAKRQTPCRSRQAKPETDRRLTALGTARQGLILKKYRWIIGRDTYWLRSSPLTGRWGIESSQDRR